MVASRFARCILFLTLATLVTACEQMKDAQNSVTEAIWPYSPTTPRKPGPTKVEVITPTAAPVLPVTVNKGEPITLGQMTDDKKLPVDASTVELPGDKIQPVKPVPLAVAANQDEAPAKMQTETPVATPTPVAPPAAAVVLKTPLPPLTGKPLMVIRFNQNHVYYESALTKAIQASEHTKPNVVYNLVSVLPNISSLAAEQQAKILSRSNENMRVVATIIQQMGVPAERIRVAKQESPVKSQEIKIFVQ